MKRYTLEKYHILNRIDDYHIKNHKDIVCQSFIFREIEEKALVYLNRGDIDGDFFISEIRTKLDSILVIDNLSDL